MENAHRVLIGSLKEHSRLSDEDIAEISSLRHEVRQLEPNADFIRQGDVSRYSVLVVSGIVGRYHLLADGRRQYLTFHIAGDLPDIQTLFIEEMDHGLCTIGPATIAFIPHEDLLGSFSRRPSFGFAIWRETLIDGAILREAITNNGARSMIARMAHLFCELFYRMRQAGLNDGTECDFRIGRVQLGEALGMSIATVDRTLQQLRTLNIMDFREGKLIIRNWTRAARIGGFNPRYLHAKRLVLMKRGHQISALRIGRQQRPSAGKV